MLSVATYFVGNGRVLVEYQQRLHHQRPREHMHWQASAAAAGCSTRVYLLYIVLQFYRTIYSVFFFLETQYTVFYKNYKPTNTEKYCGFLVDNELLEMKITL